MDLRKRVGNLVTAHRRRRGFTQQKLAELVGMSPDMISRIETGGTGLRFPTIEKLAAVLEIDPAELFIVDPVPGRSFRRPLIDLTARLARLTDAELAWTERLIDAALSPRD